MTDYLIGELAFVLHTLPYKETSLIVELFCRDTGRLPVVAKGAKRPHSALRSVLTNFQPLRVRFTGKGEVKTLTHAEWSGGQLPPEGRALFAAYYLNELLIRGLQREDPHPDLFDAYHQALSELAQSVEMNLPVRQFELMLLDHVGYGLDYATDQHGEALQADQWYVWQDMQGWNAVRSGDAEQSHGLHSNVAHGVLGQVILSWGQQKIMTQTIAQALRPITRQLLRAHVTTHGVLSRDWMECLFKND